jgi:hypothetical protein
MASNRVWIKQRRLRQASSGISYKLENIRDQYLKLISELKTLFKDKPRIDMMLVVRLLAYSDCLKRQRSLLAHEFSELGQASDFNVVMSALNESATELWKVYNSILNGIPNSSERHLIEEEFNVRLKNRSVDPNTCKLVDGNAVGLTITARKP